ncbi:hypothetical protein [Haloarcula laminariae]|uniref:hypothetical protein n=1 Tax=Haloarcula laminariae TaxID=2961577 RepID=UPI0024052FFD|nr:hypothetical protein [Halomicroarcula sp. FL173]
MTAGFDVGDYFPERPPTWLEVGLTLLVMATVGRTLLAGDVTSWPAFAVGFLLFAVAVGPVANSPVGDRVGQWFRDIGLVGRVVVIGLFLAVVTVLSRTAWVPYALVSDAGTGGLLALVLYMVGYLARAGGVEGWTSGTD